MKVGVSMERTSRDDGFDKYTIVLADDLSRFRMTTYLTHTAIAELAATLGAFASTVAGSTVAFQLGYFEPNVAGGAIQITLSARLRGQIFLAARAESEAFSFDGLVVNNRGSAYLVSQPCLIDRFVDNLLALGRGSTDVAELEASDLHQVID